MWYIYILLCSSNTYYIGSTDNVERRYKDHVNGHGGYHTSQHKPLKIVYTETFPTKSDARKREIQLKGWSVAKKRALIEGRIGDLKKLSNLK